MPNFANLEHSDTMSQNLDIAGLVTFDTIDDFFISANEIIKRLIGLSDVIQDDFNSDLGHRLIQYVHANCFQYDFQINTMAEYFNISPQHMRRIFKNHTSIGLSDYISQLKLEKSMQLLRDTEMSLNEIVLEIGNTDVSGFIRFFKKNTDQTPGQYRKRYCEN